MSKIVCIILIIAIVVMMTYACFLASRLSDEQNEQMYKDWKKYLDEIHREDDK